MTSPTRRRSPMQALAAPVSAGLRRMEAAAGRGGARQDQPRAPRHRPPRRRLPRRSKASSSSPTSPTSSSARRAEPTRLAHHRPLRRRALGNGETNLVAARRRRLPRALAGSRARRPRHRAAQEPAGRRRPRRRLRRCRRRAAPHGRLSATGDIPLAELARPRPDPRRRRPRLPRLAPCEVRGIGEIVHAARGISPPATWCWSIR